MNSSLSLEPHIFAGDLLSEELAPDSHKEHGGIIAYPRAIGKGADLVDDAYRRCVGLYRVLSQSAQSVFFFGRVHCFGDSVAVEEQLRTFRKGDVGFRIVAAAQAER